MQASARGLLTMGFRRFSGSSDKHKDEQDRQVFEQFYSMMEGLLTRYYGNLDHSKVKVDRSFFTTYAQRRLCAQNTLKVRPLNSTEADRYSKRWERPIGKWFNEGLCIRRHFNELLEINRESGGQSQASHQQIDISLATVRNWSHLVLGEKGRETIEAIIWQYHLEEDRKSSLISKEKPERIIDSSKEWKRLVLSLSIEDLTMLLIWVSHYKLTISWATYAEEEAVHRFIFDLLQLCLQREVLYPGQVEICLEKMRHLMVCIFGTDSENEDDRFNLCRLKDATKACVWMLRSVNCVSSETFKEWHSQHGHLADPCHLFPWCDMINPSSAGRRIYTLDWTTWNKIYLFNLKKYEIPVFDIRHRVHDDWCERRLTMLVPYAWNNGALAPFFKFFNQADVGELSKPDSPERDGVDTSVDGTAVETEKKKKKKRAKGSTREGQKVIVKNSEGL